MAETRRADNGRFYTLDDFVSWYGAELGHSQWAQAAGPAGAEEPRAENAGAVHGDVEELGAGAEESGAEWPQASTGGDGAGAAEPGARDLVLLQLENEMEDMARQMQDMARRILCLEDEVGRLSGELEQRGRSPTRTPQIRICASEGCGKQYGPNREGYLHTYCFTQCKKEPGSHGPRCKARCIQ